MGDVGGLLDGLKLIAATILVPFSGFNYNMLLLTKLFRFQDERKEIRVIRSPDQDNECIQAHTEI